MKLRVEEFGKVASKFMEEDGICVSELVEEHGGEDLEAGAECVLRCVRFGEGG